MNLFLNSPLTGFGFQADRFFLGGQHAHDSLLHALVQTGLLGTIPFILSFIFLAVILLRLFKNNYIEPRQRMFFIEITSVLIFLMIRGITESLAFYSADWIFLAPILAYTTILYKTKHATK